MRCLSAASLMGILVASGPISSMGFMATPKPLTTPMRQSSVKIDNASPVFIQSRGNPTTSTAMNAVNPELLACLLPPMLGFGKQEWAVSYGFGFATALSALSLITRQQQSALTTLHAASMIFFGLRLNAFLFIRNRLSPRYREIGKEIEEKANKNRPTLSKRIPFMLSVGFLFYGLHVPVLLTSKLTSDVMGGVGLAAMKALIGLQWFGYGVEALGDLTKSYVKGSEKDGKFLVTSGVYSILRHPNYSGEILAWAANLFSCALSAAYLLRNQFSLSVLGFLGLTTLSSVGMIKVLLGSTTNLEKRQKEDYGDTEKYKDWIKSTWAGWKLPETKEDESPHEITLDTHDEDLGSGI